MKIVNIMKKNKLLSLVFLIYVILFIVMPEKAILSFNNSLYYVKEMIEIMPVILILTIIIDAWIPKEVIMNGLGENSGIKGNVLSFLLGSFSAGPIYAAFPISKLLLGKGASVNNIVIILSSWAVIKVPMLANEAKFLGAKFMGIRWILTVLSILIMSFIVSKLVKKEDIPIGNKEGNIKKDSIEINEQYCIGCGLCEQILPQYFELVDKKATLKKMNLEDQFKEELESTMDKCPVKAIGYSD